MAKEDFMKTGECKIRPLKKLDSNGGETDPPHKKP